MKYSLIIPTYEEKKNICILISMIDGNLTDKKINYEIIIVDDNSPDGTSDEVLKIAEYLGNDKVKLLKRKDNSCKATKTKTEKKLLFNQGSRLNNI
jgi:dolichol-phosphate mannosyltransferase